jgi:hypothetical protein
MKYILIYILNLADYALTVYWTGLHGLEHEVNPLMRKALEEPWMFAVIKLILFPWLLLYMKLTGKDHAAWMVLGMFIVVVLVNLSPFFIA